MSEQESASPQVVPLEHTGETGGLPWIRLGLWLYLLPSALIHLGTFCAFRWGEFQGGDDWKLEWINMASTVSLVAELLGALALVLGGIQALRASHDRVVRLLLGVAVAGAALLAIRGASSIYLQLQLHVGALFSAGPSRLDVLELYRWSLIVRTAAFPALIVALVIALHRTGRPCGRPGNLAIALTAALAALVQCAMFLPRALGTRVEVDSWLGWAFPQIGLDLVILVAALAAVRRVAGAGGGAMAPGALLPDAPAWRRAASGLEIFAAALLVRALLGLVLPLCLLATTSTLSAAPLIVALLVGAVGGTASTAGMAFGANRLRAAPEAVGARAFTGAAALLFCIGVLLDGYALLAIVRLLTDQDGSMEGHVPLDAIGQMVSLLSLLAFASLLGAFGSIGRWLGDRAATARALRLALIMTVVIAGATLFNSRFVTLAVMLWTGSALFPFVSAIATLAVLLPLHRMARRLAARIRSAVPGGPPLARAVAQVRGPDAED
jgi:hypothetical protein